MLPETFAAFILTHGRPDSIVTLRSLEEAGYEGRWYLVCDSEDQALPEYRRIHGEDRVLVFDKDDTRTDMGDNGGSRGVVIYARNACEEFAQQLGLTHYVQLDDDYTAFLHRYVENGALRGIEPVRLDDVFAAFVDFLEDSGALTVAFAQGGDYIGGAAGAWRRPLLRKAMNSFIVRTGRPVEFVGRINEDVNTYVYRGMVGDLLLTVTEFGLNQVQTQAGSGGMSDTYLDGGTYIKSFYPILWNPSAVKIGLMGRVDFRIHHSINWTLAVPKIVSSRYRKPRSRRARHKRAKVTGSQEE